MDSKTPFEANVQDLGRVNYINLVTCRSRVALSVLSVFHFSVREIPYSEHLYFVSIFPETFKKK